MLELIKKFTTNELYSDNQSLCNPSVLIDDGIMIYRDGRNNPNHNDGVDDNSKLLKIVNIDRDYNTSNPRSINIEPHVLSDSKLFKWNNEAYIQTTSVIEKPDGHVVGYTCKVDIIDLKKERLLNVSYDKADKREKNWVLFQDGSDLLCSYHLKNQQHKVLKLKNNKFEDYVTTRYRTTWLSSWGEIRNTSNFSEHDNLLWGCFHSHNDKGMMSTYRMGIVAFNAHYPYQVVRMSNVPLFNIRHDVDIFYPSSLEIKGDKFIMGISFFEFDFFDIISISKEEIMNHLDNDITFDYTF